MTGEKFAQLEALSRDALVATLLDDSDGACGLVARDASCPFEDRAARVERKLAVAREIMQRDLLAAMYGREWLTSPTAVRDWLTLKLAHREQEIFMVLLLDSHNRLLSAHELFYGTLTQTSVYPREIVKLALRENAAALIAVHNHPSLLPEPSRSDELLTNSIKSALAMVDVKLLDHMVVGGSKVVSFAERGLI